MDDLIRLTGMWENTNRNGEVYYAGALGGAKLLLLRNKRAEGSDPGWTLMIAKRSDKQRDRAERSPAADPHIDQDDRQDRAADDARPPATENVDQGAPQRRQAAAAGDRGNQRRSTAASPSGSPRAMDREITASTVTSALPRVAILELD